MMFSFLPFFFKTGRASFYRTEGYTKVFIDITPLASSLMIPCSFKKDCIEWLVSRLAATKGLVVLCIFNILIVLSRNSLS